MAALAEVTELEAKIKEQAATVVAAKKGGDKDVIKAEVTKLLEMKKAMTALDPEHPQALKDKKKKKKKDKGGADGKKGPSARELAKMERLKKREAAQAKAKVGYWE